MDMGAPAVAPWEVKAARLLVRLLEDRKAPVDERLRALASAPLPGVTTTKLPQTEASPGHTSLRRDPPHEDSELDFVDAWRSPLPADVERVRAMADGGGYSGGHVRERILIEKIVLVETPPEFVERYGKEVYVKLQLRPEEWRSRLAVRLEAKKFLQERPPLTSSELPKWARYEMLTRNIRSILRNPLSYMRFKVSRRQRDD